MRPGGTCGSARGTHGVHPATPLPGSGQATMAKGDYLVDAAKHIRMALDRELSEDYQAAFNHYKNGVDLLLNGVQVDPNKERREAVKRKTAQYLKTAEDIFNSHLQGSLGNGHPQSGGYSSLRFRPIRNLSSPVEDLKMCKVVGVVDKVLTVQSLVTKETFVVKSLPKSSWESREQPTIIPQGVPFMVKLLRYYVSEDTVYLHLEHVPGGRLFSRLHRSRTDRAEGNPESSSPTGRKIRLKTSYTVPETGLALQQSEAVLGAQPSPDADHSAHWDEARRRLESCRTHSYCEETGCLHRARTRPSELDSEQSRAQSSRLASETQGSPAVSAQNCTGPVTSVALNGVWEFSARDVVRLDTSRDFDCAWSAADPARGRTERVPLLPEEVLGAGGTPSSQPSLRQDGRGHSGNRRTTSDVVLSAHPSLAMVREQTVQPGKDSTDVSATAGNSWKIRALTSIAAPAEAEATSGNSQSPVVLHCREVNAQNGIPAGNSMNPTVFSPTVFRDGAEEEWELQSPLNRDIPQTEVTGGQKWDPRPMPTAATELCEKAERAGGPAVDQPIEVDGWCLLPRVPARRPMDKTRRSCWGLPEDEVRLWGAQILLALESLHQQGILCRDLNPKNILLDHSGNVCLTYFGQWSEVQLEISTRATEHMYCAPEIGGAYEITEACDWWSLGALLFELLTGMPLWQCHPAGVLPHTQLLIPDSLSTAAASLLTELLQYDAGYRLGSGGGGVCDIKCHPFFGSVPWHMLGS